MHKTRTTMVTVSVVLIAIAVLLVTFISLRQSQAAIKLQAEKRLLLEAENLANKLNLPMQEIEMNCRQIESLIKETLDVEKLATDNNYRRQYAKLYGPVIRNIAANSPHCRVVAAYIFFDPLLTRDPFVISYAQPRNQKKLQSMPQPNPLLFYPENLSMRWYYQPIQQRHGIWSDPYYWERLDMKLLTYSSPVYVQGKLVGVVGVDVSFSEFEQYVRQIKIFSSGYAFLVNKDMNFLVHPIFSNDENLARIDDGAFLPLVETARKHSSGVIPALQFRGIDKIGAYAHMDNGYAVITVVPQQEVFETERQHTLILITMSIIIGCLMSAMAYYASRSITQPLENASRHAGMLATRLADDLPQELLQREDEVGIISRAVHEVLEQHTQEMRQSYLELIQRLSQLGEYRDTDTGQHVVRVGRYSAMFGELLGMNSEEVETLLYATPMHDIGKVGLPDAILRKEEALSSEEMQLMKEHTRIGANILSGGDSPLLEMAYQVALTHHERWDGLGYLRGLHGEEIELAARICCISDALDAITTDRPYRKARSFSEAIEEIKANSGTHFDPQLVKVLVDNADIFYDLYVYYQ